MPRKRQNYETNNGWIFDWDELSRCISIGSSGDTIDVRTGPRQCSKWIYLPIDQFQTKREALTVAKVELDRLEQQLFNEGHSLEWSKNHKVWRWACDHANHAK